MKFYRPVLCGMVRAPESKSMLHRMLICAALSDWETKIECHSPGDDIAATIRCLNSLGAEIERKDDILRVSPISAVRHGAKCDAGQSGSTLRFLLPVSAALSADAVFSVGDTLARRPLYPLDEVMREHGAEVISSGDEIRVRGELVGQSFTIDGGVSSQFISGLMLATPLIGDKTEITVTGRLSSEQYLAMTAECMNVFGCTVTRENGADKTVFTVSGKYRSPGKVSPGGDRTNSAVWLVCGALSERPVAVTGIDYSDRAGDGIIVTLLESIGADISVEKDRITVRRGKKRLKAFDIDADGIPDLVPILCTLASVCEGTSRISGCARLRLKESDRISSTVGMLSSLGADIHAEGDSIIICGRNSLNGGAAQTYSDHRIAMAAAVASIVCEGAVTVMGSECADKSYPSFYEDFKSITVTDGKDR